MFGCRVSFGYREPQEKLKIGRNVPMPAENQPSALLALPTYAFDHPATSYGFNLNAVPTFFSTAVHLNLMHGVPCGGKEAALGRIEGESGDRMRKEKCREESAGSEVPELCIPQSIFRVNLEWRLFGKEGYLASMVERRCENARGAEGAQSAYNVSNRKSMVRPGVVWGGSVSRGVIKEAFGKWL